MSCRYGLKEYFTDILDFNNALVPERSLDPPDENPVSLDLAEKHLRESLKLFKDSPYWNDFVQILFEEITDDEADMVVADLIGYGRLSNLSKTSFVMMAARERAYRVCAEKFIVELCS